MLTTRISRVICGRIEDFSATMDKNHGYILSMRTFNAVTLKLKSSAALANLIKQLTTDKAEKR